MRNEISQQATHFLPITTRRRPALCSTSPWWRNGMQRSGKQCRSLFPTTRSRLAGAGRDPPAGETRCVLRCREPCRDRSLSRTGRGLSHCPTATPSRKNLISPMPIGVACDCSRSTIFARWRSSRRRLLARPSLPAACGQRWRPLATKRQVRMLARLRH